MNLQKSMLQSQIQQWIFETSHNIKHSLQSSAPTYTYIQMVTIFLSWLNIGNKFSKGINFQYFLVLYGLLKIEMTGMLFSNFAALCFNISSSWRVHIVYLSLGKVRGHVSPRDLSNLYRHEKSKVIHPYIFPLTKCSGTLHLSTI